ncbi:ANTAR domain-containing protein [Geodermatophilus sp. SYSU D01176]
MTDTTENVDRPIHPGRASVDPEAVRASGREARARAAELRVQLDERRRQYRATTGRGDRRPVEPRADELAELRTRAEAAEGRAEHLERAVASNRRIGMAIGILLARLQCTEEEAFEVLRQESMRRNVKVSQLAEQVVYTGTL